jgi:hypothetical protein
VAGGSRTSKKRLEDPGWRRAVNAQLFPIKSRKTQKELDGVTVMRILFVALMQAAFAGGLILVIITRTFGEIQTVLLIVILVLGAVGVAGARWARERPLATTSEEDLAKTYRTNFFIGFAVCELPLLVGIVAGMIRQELWPYLFALPLFVVGMRTIAPTVGNIEYEQNKLSASGSTLSLRGALMAPPPKTTKRA